MKRLGKLLLTAGLITTLAFGAIGCGNSKESNGTKETESASEDTEKIKVRIGCVGENNVLTDALGVAQEKGYLEEEMGESRIRGGSHWLCSGRTCNQRSICGK